MKVYAESKANRIAAVIFAILLASAVLVFAISEVRRGLAAGEANRIVGSLGFLAGSFAAIFAWFWPINMITVYPDGTLEFRSLLQRIRLHARQILAVRQIDSKSRQSPYIVVEHAMGTLSLIGSKDGRYIEHFSDFITELRALNPSVQIGEFAPRMPRATVPNSRDVIVRPVGAIAQRRWSMPVLAASSMVFAPLVPTSVVLALMLISYILHGHPVFWPSVGMVFVLSVLISVRTWYRGMEAVFTITLTEDNRVVFQRLFGRVSVRVDDITAIATSTRWVEIRHRAGHLVIPTAMPNLDLLAGTLQQLNPRLTCDVL